MADEQRGHESDPASVRVDAIMNRRPFWIDAEATMGEARAQMHAHGIHHLLVGAYGRFVAVLSDRDVLRKISPRVGTASERAEDLWTLQRKVFQAATYRPITASPETSVLEAAAILLSRGISCLPVMGESGRVAGLVTTRDLLQALVSCALPERPARDAA